MTGPDASKMPARIAVANSGLCQWALPGDYASPNTEYVRADLAEQMASVLKAIRSEMNAGLGSSYGETREQVRRALSAWDASNPARQASNGDRHAGEAGE
jgi:hypothetical protein